MEPASLLLYIYLLLCTVRLLIPTLPCKMWLERIGHRRQNRSTTVNNSQKSHSWSLMLVVQQTGSFHLPRERCLDLPTAPKILSCPEIKKHRSKPKETPDGDDALVTFSLPAQHGLTKAGSENPVGLPLLLPGIAFSTENGPKTSKHGSWMLLPRKGHGQRSCTQCKQENKLFYINCSL